MKIILATQNKGKVEEVKDIFKDSPFEIVSLNDLGNNIDVEETGSTFSENAFLKAKAVYEIYKKPVISDDSGLVVEQLDGRPGVISARYAGENCTYKDNNLKIISELKEFPEPHKAKFVSLALFFNGKDKIEVEGELLGEIIKEERGKGGFGYDPVFIPEGYSKTVGELTFEEKNRISHRAESFNKLKEILIKKFGK